MPDASAPFEGFHPEAIAFLAELAENNTREWFQPRKADYERLLKVPMERLCVALEDEFRARSLPLHADPARSPFRIYRDVRFSKDKSPYKTAASASFRYAGDGDEPGAGRSHTEHVHAGGGYFHLQPGEIYVGGGVWHPDPAWLKAFRGRVVDDYEAFRAITGAPAFVETFGAGRRRRRVAPAGAAGLPGGPSGRGPAPEEERDLRPAAVGRGGAEPLAAHAARGRVRRRHAAPALPGGGPDRGGLTGPPAVPILRPTIYRPT